MLHTQHALLHTPGQRAEVLGPSHSCESTARTLLPTFHACYPCRHSLGDLMEAATALNQAIELQPGNSAYWYNLAFAFAEYAAGAQAEHALSQVR